MCRFVMLGLNVVLSVFSTPTIAQPAEATSAVPQGTITQSSFAASNVFPGTTRNYWVYVPKQYDPANRACVFVCNDGIMLNAPAVFDKLIHEKAMPVTVGVFVSSGVVIAPSGAARMNRSFEYDGLGDCYVRFLVDELLPHVAKAHNLNLSTNGNDRCIAGLSSGGICAFTAAWERPDAFCRVFSGIGSFTGFRGGNQYPVLVRKMEPKPIRVFLQDGNHDLNICAGNWWLVNQEMESSLSFTGYEVQHAWGVGGHDGGQATEVFADAMRWLWKDWPTPIKVGAGSNHHREILLPGEPWKPVGQGYQGVTGMAVNANGEVFFNDPPTSKTYKIGLDGRVGVFLADSKGGCGQAFGPDNRLYSAAAGVRQLVAYDAQGNATVVAEGIRGHGLVVDRNGHLYVTEPDSGNANSGRLWLIDINRPGEKKLVDTHLAAPAGVTPSCDQAFLSVADSRSRWLYSYEIRPDGSLTNRQPFEWLHVSDTADGSGADGLCTDQNGCRYAATHMGIQVCSREGRVTCIIPTPNGRIASLCFGGKNFDILFAACGDTVYERKVKVRGACPFQSPVKGSPEIL